MKYINHNPSLKKTGDCVIRAIAGATGDTWEDTLDGLVRYAKKLHTSPTNKECYQAYLIEEKGYKKNAMPKLRKGKRVTSKELAQEVDAIIQQANHLVFSEGGHVVDSWNSEERSVYNYYTKE